MSIKHLKRLWYIWNHKLPSSSHLYETYSPQSILEARNLRSHIYRKDVQYIQALKFALSSNGLCYYPRTCRSVHREFFDHTCCALTWSIALNSWRTRARKRTRLVILLSLVTSRRYWLRLAERGRVTKKGQRPDDLPSFAGASLMRSRNEKHHADGIHHDRTSWYATVNGCGTRAVTGFHAEFILVEVLLSLQGI